MLHRWARGLFTILAVVLLAPAGSGALPVFQETFDAEPGAGDGASGESSLDHMSFSQWTVSDGTVDLIANGDFGISCLGDTGKCVDLDGASRDAGVLTSDAILLEPGTYELEFWLAGTSSVFTQTAASAPNTVEVAVDELFSDSLLLEQGDPFQAFTGTFVVDSLREVRIRFENLGGDNFGAMLDDVTLRMVPEPQTTILLLVLIATGLVYRLRKGLAGDTPKPARLHG